MSCIVLSLLIACMLSTCGCTRVNPALLAVAVGGAGRETWSRYYIKTRGLGLLQCRSLKGGGDGSDLLGNSDASSEVMGVKNLVLTARKLVKDEKDYLAAFELLSKVG